ncbi:MAG: roadblock/LC7 domain-containing protein [Methanomicrobiales archaeon]
MSILDIEKQLEKVLSDLERIDGIDGSLLADNSGKIICHRMHRYSDVDLFGSMSNVIVNSSERLLDSSNQGKIERVLIESINGKALFLDLGKINFIILMEISANIGLVMVSAKRTAEKIIEISKDLVIPADKEVEEKIILKTEETPITGKTELVQEKVIPTVPAENLEMSKSVPETPVKTSKSIISEKEPISSENEISKTDTEPTQIEEIVTTKAETPILKEVSTEVSASTANFDEEQVVEQETLPLIKPPISFPKLPENVEIPEDAEKRSELILDIYEAIFLAMSLGASKIMGVAPARGLTKKFLPLENCKKLLTGVDVKTNSVVDFEKIRDNADEIDIKIRQETLITDFSKIIEIITENYGKVMGYDAFRGMVRPEFDVIKKSYGQAMEQLDIKNKIHPELIDLLN